MINTREILFIMMLLPISLFGQTTYYISSSTGNDSNAGTSTSEAWSTLNKVNAQHFSPGDQILFKRGDSWEGTLKPNSSGTKGSPIKYGAYGAGEKPKLYGSKLVTNWSLHKGNIYKAQIQETVSQVFVNNNRMQAARLPNTGYIYPTTAVSDQTTIQCDNLDSGIDYSGANIIARSYRWRYWGSTVASSSGTTLKLDAGINGNISTSEGFILTKKLDFLDQAGEWFYDSETNTLYVWTPNGDSPSNHIIRASVSDYSIYNYGNDYISFENIQFLHAGTTGGYFESTTGIRVENCDVKGVGRYAVRGKKGTAITINNCVIKDSSSDAILLSTPNSTISNNTIQNIGRFSNIGANCPGTSTAIVTTGDNITFSYNLIDNIAYNGIMFSGQNNLISNNVIKNINMNLDDGAAIYTYQAQTGSPGSGGSIIKENIVLNIYGSGEGRLSEYPLGFGIYLDKNTHDVVVEKNTVAHCSGAFILGEGNQNNVFKNNTAFDFALGLWAGSSTLSANGTFNNNILCTTSRLSSFIWWKNSYQRFIKLDGLTKLTSFDNTYVSHHNSEHIFDADNPSFSTFENWKRDTGQDLNSNCDNTKLNTGEKEELFYNGTKNSKVISLGQSVYKDIYNNRVTGSITLEPFTSKILIKTTESISSPLNQPPLIDNQTFDVSTVLNANDLIGNVAASDPDVGQLIVYQITNGNTDNLFSIDQSSGAIYATSAISLTSDKSYALTIQVTDNGNSPLSAEATITINIKKTALLEDTTPPTIEVFSIPSTFHSLTIPISSLIASDNDSISSYLVTESSSTPSLENSNWSSSMPNEYTFAEEGIHSLFAWAVDVSGNISNAKSADIIISLPDLSPASSEYHFEEVSGATVIDTKGSNDGTLINETTRVDGYNGAGIELNGAGYIALGESFSNNIQEELTLSARLKPNLNASGYQGIIMHGGPNVDNFALYILPDNKSIGFKTSGTSNAWVSIENINKLWDGNWHHLAVTYNGTEKRIYLDNLLLTAVSATGRIDSGSGYNLYIGAGRDEIQPSLLYQGLIDEVRINNRALNSYEIVDLVNFSNPNEIDLNATPSILDQTFEVAGNLTINNLVGQVTASDPDAEQNLTYRITAGNEKALFSIDSITGDIFTQESILTETDQSHVLTIEVTDNGQTPLSAEAFITLRLIGVFTNQNPVISDQIFELKNNVTTGDLIGIVMASDPDEGQTISYFIESGNNDGLFSLNSSSGEIYLSSDIPENYTNETLFIVKVVDNYSGDSLSAQATITISNLGAFYENQGPEILAQTFLETAPLATNSRIGQVIASDQNLDQTLSFSIIQGNENNVFSINANTGEIFTNQSFASNSEYYNSITVQATDNHPNNPLASSATITIKISASWVNEPPVAQDLVIDISNNVAINDYIGQVIATDPNQDQTLSYTITQGNDDNLFSINESTGEIFALSSIFTTSDIQYNFVVEIKDDAEIPLSALSNVSINITGMTINHSPVIEDQAFEIHKNDKIGNVIGQVIANDPDLEQTLTYAITEGNELGYFEINSQTGEIITTSSMSLTGDQTFVLTVEVTDDASIPLSADAAITVSAIINGKLVKGEVNNNNSKRIILYYDTQLKTSNLKSTALISDFKLSDNRNIQDVKINGNMIFLEVDEDYMPGEEVTLCYTPGATAIYTATGYEVDSFENFVIANNLEESITTGIDVNETILDAKVYPNPTNGILNIKASNLISDQCQLSLYSMMGRIVIKKTLLSSFGNLEETINVSHLSKGTYLLVIESDQAIHKDKIVVI
ncbi:cadherin domain-containing protein [Sunxiuqinia indica]|uniref:cadherin domain-containing protein n=1 Tax=Sunxiuqinia indica TaxID=2692584 RepID=UPI00135C0478|nr:cadherin domain-containing protein [Sunxiuqinia indica]